MHRLFLGVSLCILTTSIVLTGCGQSEKPQGIAQLPGDDKVPPGEAKPIPPGEARPISGGDPSLAPLPDTKTDPDTLPVLPTLSAPTGQEKYDAAIGRAFLLMAEKKDAEALDALKEAQSAQQTDFVKSEMERLQGRIAKREAAQQAADAIKEVLDAGKATEAAALAADALGQYGDSDLAETLTGLKRQADALAGAGLEGKARQQKFLDDAEAARKANNIRSAVLSYEQAVAQGGDPGDLKDTYESLRIKLAKYDDSRAKATEYRKDPLQLELAHTTLKVAADNWDTQQVRQEISEVEVALNNRRDRVAITDFEETADIGVPRAGHVIAEELVGHLRPRFDVVERSQVKALYEEMKLDQDTLLVNDTIRGEFGRLAKARYVVLGSVNRLSGIHVNARLVDTQTGLIVQTARIVASNPEEMSNRLPALGRMLQMNDDEKRAYENKLAEQARPVAPPTTTELPPAPPPPTADAPPAPPPPPIVVYTPRPPVYGNVVVADFDGFRVLAVGAPPPPPVVIVESPPVVRDRAFFVAVELGDNCFRRGDFRLALRHFEFALSLNPGHSALRMRLIQCRPLCPPPVVVVPITRPRMVVLPFAEFRDPFAGVSSIPLGTGGWTADALAPYFGGSYDIVDRGEVFWWMGRLGLTMRDVMTDAYARLTLGRALGARFFLMGSLREIASFDVTSHIIDAELNCQVFGSRIRVQNAGELRYRLPELARLTVLPPAQQVVVIEQQQVVQRKVIEAQAAFKIGKFNIALGFYKEVLETNPQHAEARSMLVQVEFRQRQFDMEAARVAAWHNQQAAYQAQRERQIALAAAAQGAREQSRRDMQLFSAVQKQQLAEKQALAQQNLILQAQLAQRQNNHVQRVAYLESAVAIQRTDALVQQLAQAKAELAVEQQKRIAAEQALHVSELKRQQTNELAKSQGLLLVAKDKQNKEAEERLQAQKAQVDAEYNRFIDLGKRSQENKNYPAAASAFQNARRLKPSPEVEALVSSALDEQAKAEALKKGDAERKKLEAQLAQEEQKRKQLEVQNAQLKVKYQNALAKAQDAMKAQRYDEAVTSFRLASQTIQTDEAEGGLKQAQAELAKVKITADAEAKKKAEEDRKLAAINKQLTDGRAAVAAKQFDKAVNAFRAAAALKPDDVEIQKALTQAELSRDEAAAAVRKKDPVVAKTTPLPKPDVSAIIASARVALRDQKFDEAEAQANRAGKLDPDNAAVKRLLTDIDAAKKVAVLPKKEPMPKKGGQIDDLLVQARTAIRGKDLATAYKLLNQAAAIDPNDPDLKKAQQEYTAVRTEMANASAENAKKQMAYEAAMKAAQVAMAGKQYDDAIKNLTEALRIKPGDPAAMRMLADAKKADSAADTAAMEAKKKKEAYDAAMRLGRAAMAKKDYDDAIKAFNDALKADPGDPTATAGLKQARDAQAATGLDAKRKELYTAWLDRAEKLMAARQFENAVEAYQNALKAMPGDAVATRGLAEARAAMSPKKDPPAKDPPPRVDVKPKDNPPKIDTKPKADPNAAKVADLLKTGGAQEDGGKYAEAYRTYQEVLKLAPTNAEAKKRSTFCQWMDQGSRQLANGKLADAATSFDQALKIDPNDENAKSLLKQARAKKK